MSLQREHPVRARAPVEGAASAPIDGIQRRDVVQLDLDLLFPRLEGWAADQSYYRGPARLHLAALNNEQTELLVDCGADLSVHIDGETHLHFAAYMGGKDVVQPLKLDAREGHTEGARLLRDEDEALPALPGPNGLPVILVFNLGQSL